MSRFIGHGLPLFIKHFCDCRLISMNLPKHSSDQQSTNLCDRFLVHIVPQSAMNIILIKYKLLRVLTFKWFLSCGFSTHSNKHSSWVSKKQQMWAISKKISVLFHCNSNFSSDHCCMFKNISFYQLVVIGWRFLWKVI